MRSRSAAPDLAQTPVNGTYVHDPTKLDGANVWLLQYISSVSGVQISYEKVFLPDALYYNASRGAQLSYLFDGLGYDCAFMGTPLSGDVVARADFLAPNEQGGLAVVTSFGRRVRFVTMDMLFSWTQPCAPARALGESEGRRCTHE